MFRISHAQGVAVIVVAGLLLALSGCGPAGDTSPEPDRPTSGSGTAGPSGPIGSSAPPSPLAGGAPGSTVTGHYLEQATRTSVRRPVGGGTVALYQYFFQPGTNARAGSEAAGGTQIASATVGPDARFVLRAVPDGVWFLTRTDRNVVVEGRWVKVTATEGAAVDLVGCSQCPPAQ